MSCIREIMRLKKKRELIFELTIDDTQFLKDVPVPKIEEVMRKRESSVQELIRDTETIILNRLPSDLDKIYGIRIETRVIDVREGSLVIFFGVVLYGLGIVANYKNFYDSIQLARHHCRGLVERLVKDKYKSDWRVNVCDRYPTVEDPREIYRYRKFPPEMLEEIFAGSSPYPNRSYRRDGFFWFLLILCVVLATVLGLLIYPAMIKTYFP